jgi:hypothetical protein
VKALPLTPAFYAGEVSHSRRSPLRHQFRYRVGYWLVDYDELPQPRGWHRLLGTFRSADHMDIRSVLGEHGLRAHRILMLATPRRLGYAFNPISVFWCYDTSGEQTAVLAEVHNTYGGQHTYLVQATADGWAEVAKSFYVSPFYPVDGRYRIEVSAPGTKVSVTVELLRDGDEPFIARLQGTRRLLGVAGVVKALVDLPGGRTRLRIYGQALRLWRKGLEVQPR